LVFRMAFKLQEELITFLLDPNEEEENKMILVTFWVHINTFPNDVEAARRNGKIQSRRNEFKTTFFDLDFEKEVTRKLEVEMIKGSFNVKKDGRTIWFPEEMAVSFLEKQPKEKVEIVKQYLPLLLFPKIGFKISDYLFRCLIKEYEATCEVFCNPLEVKLNDHHFLFPWEDKFDLGGKCSIVNPPHVSAFIDELKDVILEERKEKGTCLFVFLPDDDLSSINDLISEANLMLKRDDILLLIFVNKYQPWKDLGSGPLTSAFFY
jgi:hypothetical protein